MTSRERFEAWFEEWFGDKPLSGWNELWCGDGYSSETIDAMWESWQASRAAIEQGEIVAYQDFYGNAISGGDFDGGDDEMHETAFNEQWTPLIKADGIKVKK